MPNMGRQNGSCTLLVDAIAKEILIKAFPPITFIDLHVTDDCNLRCPYCFVHGKRNNQMTDDVAFAAVDFLIRESRDQDILRILFIGGEPLLEFDLMQRIVLYAGKASIKHRKRINYDTTTNGTLFNEEILEFFRDSKISFLLSMDGGKESHDMHRKFAGGIGSFDTVVSKIPLMKKYQPWLGIRVTPTPQTISRLFEDVKELYQLGANQFIIGPATGVTWSFEDFALYQSQMLLIADWYVKLKRRRAHLRINQFGDDASDLLGNKQGIWGCGAGKSRISISTSG
ncbi:MAG: radical SAM protein [bacterium]|jgi:uncharacterized protein